MFLAWLWLGLVASPFPVHVTYIGPQIVTYIGPHIVTYIGPQNCISISPSPSQL